MSHLPHEMGDPQPGVDLVRIERGGEHRRDGVDNGCLRFSLCSRKSWCDPQDESAIDSKHDPSRLCIAANRKIRSGRSKAYTHCTRLAPKLASGADVSSGG